MSQFNNIFNYKQNVRFPLESKKKMLKLTLIQHYSLYQFAVSL